MAQIMIGIFDTNKDLLEVASSRTALTAVLALFVGVLVLYQRAGRKKYKLPPGPTGLPVLGYVPFLGSEPHKELDRLKKIYGNVFTVSMGLTRVVILGDFEAVKDAFSKTGTLYRPEKLFDFLPDDAGFTSRNGGEWTEQRRFCVRTMKEHGVGREKWESMIQMEVEDFIKQVSSYNGKPFDFSKLLSSSVSNNISSFIFGKRLPLNHPDRAFIDKGMEDLLHIFTQSGWHYAFPIIRNVSAALGIGSSAKAWKNIKGFNNFFRKQVANLKKSYADDEHDNFIVDYLKEIDSNKGKTGHYFNETNLFGNIQTLFIGGSDTTEISLAWLFLAMAEYPDIQAKIHQEVDSVLGKDGQIQWTNRKILPYTYATIMEGQRWRTVIPLNSTRMTKEDVRVQNYDIPKGTHIIANNWGVHNDPKYWKEPEKFDPLRFLTEDGKDVKSKPDAYVPFSYGKRNCPGEIIAQMEILIYFTSLMQKFTISVPKGKCVNLDGIMGLTYHYISQELQFIPREKLS